MKYVAAILLILTMLGLSNTAHAQESSLDNLPLPRWAVLASQEINLRTGPGKRYPIDWVLKKKGLPVEITREFEFWRLVREPNGASGWAHKSMLASVRNVMIQNGSQNLYAKPTEDSRVTASLQQGVLARIEICHKHWCQLKVENYSGWAKKENLWGVYPKETME